MGIEWSDSIVLTLAESLKKSDINTNTEINLMGSSCLIGTR